MEYSNIANYYCFMLCCIYIFLTSSLLHCNLGLVEKGKQTSPITNNC